MSATACSSPASPRPKLKLGFNEAGIAYAASAALLLGAALWCGLGPQIEHTDFSMTYVGARIVHLGRGARLYDMGEQIAQRQSTFRDPSPLLFEHPPFEALIFSPLAALPYRTAYTIWALVNAIIWLSLPLLLRPQAPRPRETLGYLALWLLFAPLGVALFQGQSSLALLLLYTLCFLQLKRGRELTAGALLGLGLFKFQFVLPLALIFLLRRQWRFLAGFAVSGAFLGALSVAAVGWRGLVSYAEFLHTVAGNPHNASYGNAVGMATLQGFFNTVFGPFLNGAVISVLVAAATLGLIGLTAWQWKHVESLADRPHAHDLMFAAAVGVSLAAGFHMFVHDFSPLALGLFLIAANFPAAEPRWLRYLLGTAMALFWIPPFFFALLAKHSAYLIFPVLMALVLGALKLAAAATASDEQGGAGARHPVLTQVAPGMERMTS